MSGLSDPETGIVYTETMVWAPPAAYAQDAPYQLAIIIDPSGGRITGRITGDRTAIGDRVVFVERRDSVPYFRLAR